MKVALVTGAAQGIGRRTAEVLAHRGFSLALNDLRSPAETGAQARSHGVDVIDVLGDVSDEAAVACMADAVMTKFGRIDALVNNAGISSITPAEEITVDEWRRVMGINLLGPFLCCRAFGRIMLQQRSGSIINVASVAGLLGVADRAAYNASKHGLIGLTRTLAAEWGGRGVRCNAVCPGWVKTPMDDSAQDAGLYADSDITGRVPMARFATPDDIAQAIVFLADPAQSSFVNGHALSVDGGWASDGSWESLRLGHR
ncbi:MAG TPA: SDR family oxidoreductase [Terriglobales bacterium]|jgi:NAD(P)-dependent dehydrogenase (short-subunit alcohol dehydrogenase family)